MKEFTYIVGNGNKYIDNKAFGDAWRQAKAEAMEHHTFIRRLEKNKGVTKEQYYHISGIFLDMIDYKEEKEKIW